MSAEGLNDAEDFLRVKAALEVLGVTEQERDDYFSLISAILHLGNIKFNAESENVCR
jgi:myosin heavy subunit